MATQAVPRKSDQKSDQKPNQKSDQKPNQKSDQKTTQKPNQKPSQKTNQTTESTDTSRELKTLNKAIKVKKSTPETTQLEIFIAGLGVQEKAEIYLYNQKAYININLILPVLSVSSEWFVKNAENRLHYIIVGGKIFVNKYGLTKLLGQSKEAVAFDLQDYIYEVITKLETDGTVSTSDVKSRNKLSKTLAELNIYKASDVHNQIVIKEITDELEVLRSDYGMLEAEYNKLHNEQKKITSDYEESKNLVDKLKQVNECIVLKCKVKNPAEMLQKIYDKYKVETDVNTNIDDIELPSGELTSPKSSKKPKKAATKKDSSGKKEYYIMQSVYPTTDDNYIWRIIDVLPQDDLKNYEDYRQFSDAVRMGEPCGYYNELWHSDICLTEAQTNLLAILLYRLGAMNESLLHDIINSVIKF